MQRLAKGSGSLRAADDGLDQATKLVAHSVAADAHGHPRAILPTAVRRFAERVAAVPSDPLESLGQGRINVAVVTAVGDPLGTATHLPGPVSAVCRQLAATRREAFRAAMTVATSVVDVNSHSPTRILLGIEGADALASDPADLDRFYAAGVRVVGLVHYADNAFGTIGTSISGSRSSRRVRTHRRQPGLTSRGVELLESMNELGMVVDLAHADSATTFDVCRRSTSPVICSHTGASRVRDFPRYISDPEIEAIAATGGVVGLWPARVGAMAMNDMDDFARHATHLVELVGAEHVCIGTDKNGVAGYARGYNGSQDFAVLAAALLRAGISTGDVAEILGQSLVRVLAHVIDTPPPSPTVPAPRPGGRP